VAAVVPITRPHAIAAGLRYNAVAIALAVSTVTAVIRPYRACHRLRRGARPAATVEVRRDISPLAGDPE